MNLLRALPDPQPGTVEILGIDDFALHRGQVYGTVLLDMVSGRPVEVLPGRDAEPVADWAGGHGLREIARQLNLDRKPCAASPRPPALTIWSPRPKNVTRSSTGTNPTCTSGGTKAAETSPSCTRKCTSAATAAASAPSTGFCGRYEPWTPTMLMPTRPYSIPELHTFARGMRQDYTAVLN